MNVSDMLTLMGNLGVGETSAVESPNDVFLSYLNLAHTELYRKTASFNSDILVNETLQNVAGETTITLTNRPLIVAKIFRSGAVAELKGLQPLDFASYKFQYTSPSDPVIYYFQKTTVNFYPSIDGTVYTFDTWYVPEITQLTVDTTEDQIPYPISYQPILVWGALKYLFADEGGFKDRIKQQNAANDWEKGKAELVSYLAGANKQILSTFRNA